MAIHGIDHYTIRTDDLAATRRFYCDLLGLHEGWRPNFDFPGAWLYVGDQPVVHVIEVEDCPREGTGGVDHLAFKADGDLKALAGKLKAAGFDVATRDVPGTPVRQLFCNDPSGVKVELNFPPAA
jgi:catechol 2,3-dioxygenase-like lactoylglutathione lyase family enzyme